MPKNPSDIAPEVPELQQERHQFPGPDSVNEADDREPVDDDKDELMDDADVGLEASATAPD